MSAVAVYGDLLELGQPVVATDEAAARLGTTTSNAGHRLRSAARAGLVVHLAHGLWALAPDASPRVIAPYLTAPQPAYVSVWSALAHHDMIEQIPRRTSVVSTARTRRFDTPLGDFDIHHLAPSLFDGFVGDPACGYMASPEKAVFDLVYLRATRGGEVHLPELSLPSAFDTAQIATWLTRVTSGRLRSMVAARVHQVLEHADA